MKRVSFKVAKAIKKAGYPQDIKEVYKENGEYFTSYIKYSNTFAAPTYLDVWIWLWRNKKVYIELLHDVVDDCADTGFGQGKDPEEAIIAAIEYLCDNDLIK